jgi:hypothetical protein
MVGNRFGVGWTFNFANRTAWLVLAGIVAAPAGSWRGTTKNHHPFRKKEKILTERTVVVTQMIPIWRTCGWRSADAAGSSREEGR